MTRSPNSVPSTTAKTTPAAKASSQSDLFFAWGASVSSACMRRVILSLTKDSSPPSVAVLNDPPPRPQRSAARIAAARSGPAMPLSRASSSRASSSARLQHRKRDRAVGHGQSKSLPSCASHIRSGSRWHACARSCSSAAASAYSSSVSAISGGRMMRGRTNPTVATAWFWGDPVRDRNARQAARATTAAKGNAPHNRQLGTRSAQAGSTNAQPQSAANTSTAGPNGNHMRRHARRSSARPLAATGDPVGHQPAAVRALPHSRATRTASTNSRSITRPPAGGHRPLQLVQKPWIQGLHCFH